MNFKEKLQNIERIKTNKVYAHNMPNDTLLRQIFLRRLIGSLIELDCYVSSLKDTMEDSFSALYPTSTPIESSMINKQAHNKYNMLRDGLIFLFDSLDSFEIDFLLFIFDRYILLCNTKNIQFLIFELLRKHPKKILNFFFKKLKEKKYFSYFISYFVGIIVRFRMNEELKNKSIELFINHFFSFKMEDHSETTFIHLCQSLIYLSCFEKRVYYDNKALFDDLIKDGILKRINRNVSEVFIGTFNINIKFVSDYEFKEILEFFPFDVPCIYEIKERIRDIYIHFNK